MNDEIDATITREQSATADRFTIRCRVCNADLAGRWKSPPAMIFVTVIGRTAASERTRTIKTSSCTPVAIIYRRSERKRSRSARRPSAGKKVNYDERQQFSQRAGGKGTAGNARVRAKREGHSRRIQGDDGAARFVDRRNEETHARRKAAMDVCVSVLVNLNDEDRYIVRDRLLDLFDLADGKLEPSDVSPW